MYIQQSKCHSTTREFDDLFDEFVQERRNSIANALELRLSCTNPSIWDNTYIVWFTESVLNHKEL